MTIEEVEALIEEQEALATALYAKKREVTAVQIEYLNNKYKPQDIRVYDVKCRFEKFVESDSYWSGYKALVYKYKNNGKLGKTLVSISRTGSWNNVASLQEEV